MSMTRSQRRTTAQPHSASQWTLKRRLVSTMVRARFGIRANTPTASGPQATVIAASGWARIRWSSRPVESTASPTRLAVMNRTRIG